MKLMNGIFDQIGVELYQLEEKLGVILMPPEPGPPVSDGPPQQQFPPQSAFSDALLSFAGRMQTCQNGIRILRERVDL